MSVKCIEQYVELIKNVSEIENMGNIEMSGKMIPIHTYIHTVHII